MQRKVCERCGELFDAHGPARRCKHCRKKQNLERQKWTHRPTPERAEENSPSWKGGKAPQTFRRIAFRHYGKICQRCGTTAVLVHHKDEDRDNNDVENLEPLCKRCHQLHHDCTSNLPEKVKIKPKPCSDCGKEFRPSGPRSVKCDDCGGGHKYAGRQNRTYGQRTCPRCNQTFTAHSWNAQMCTRCRQQRDRERSKERNHRRTETRAKG